MRIILDTDKKTITVPWNYQDKLNAMNAMIMEVTGDESKKKTFKGYINDIWNECMADSDKHVVTGKKPPKPDKKGWYYGEKSHARWNYRDEPPL